MARNLEEIEKELMTLPEQDRAQLAYDLLQSLHDDTTPLGDEAWHAAWKAEIQQRLEEFETGKAELVNVEQVMQGLKEKYAIK